MSSNTHTVYIRSNTQKNNPKRHVHNPKDWWCLGEAVQVVGLWSANVYTVVVCECVCVCVCSPKTVPCHEGRDVYMASREASATAQMYIFVYDGGLSRRCFAFSPQAQRAHSILYT